MANLEEVRAQLHTIKAWLYHNYLVHVPGQFVARLRTDKALTVEEVAAAAVTRGGFDMNYDTLVVAVKAFLEEVMYQLADGFGVENEFFSIHPKISGTFEHADSPVDKERNKVDFTFRKRRAMREVINHITVHVEGVADSDAYIAEFQDIVTGSIDEALTPNGAFRVLGRHLKIVGEDPANGVYFAPAEGGSDTKVTGNFIENFPGSLVAMVPELGNGQYRVRVVTQYSSGGTLLKEPRIIEYAPELTVGG